MIQTGSSWRAIPHSSTREEADKNIAVQFDELEKLLDDLNLGRSNRIAQLVFDSEARLEKEKYDREMVYIQKEKELEQQKIRHEKEQQRRLAEMKAAQAQAEAERRKRQEIAEKLAQEELQLEKERKLSEEKAKAEEKSRAARAEEARKQAERKAEEARKQAAEEAEREAKKQAEQKAAQKAKESENAAKRGGTMWPEVEKEYSEYIKRIQWIKTNVKDAMANQPKEVKSQIMDIKLQLRPRFGQLTNSKSQLIQCRDAVKAIFSSTQSNPLVYHWVLNLYAKMLVEQSESEANVKHQNALPLAMLTVLLWGEFPEVGEFVIPRFVKRCPQIIGYYCPINTQEGRKKMGWKRDEDSGKFESEDQYMGRLSGICAVWACMTQTKLSAKALQGSHPYPLSHSWKFMARQLNKPMEDVVSSDYAIVAAWWDMTAMRFHEAFGKQATKMLDLAWNTWTEGKSDPPAMRLRGLGENWKSTGKIEAAWKPLQP